MASVASLTGIHDEHNFETSSPVIYRPPEPVAEAPKPAVPLVLPSAEIKIKAPARVAGRQAEPQQWTGLSSQIARDYQQDERNNSAGAHRPAAPKPVVHEAPAKPQTVPVLLPSAQIKLDQSSATAKIGQAKDVGPLQWAGITAMLDDMQGNLPAEMEPPAAATMPQKQEAFPVNEILTTAPTGPEAPVKWRMSKGESSPSCFEPQQWGGLTRSADLDSLTHNLMPSPESHRQRQRRLSRELEQENR